MDAGSTDMHCTLIQLWVIMTGCSAITKPRAVMSLTSFCPLACTDNGNSSFLQLEKEQEKQEDQEPEFIKVKENLRRTSTVAVDEKAA